MLFPSPLSGQTLKVKEVLCLHSVDYVIITVFGAALDCHVVCLLAVLLLCTILRLNHNSVLLICCCLTSLMFSATNKSAFFHSFSLQQYKRYVGVVACGCVL